MNHIAIFNKSITQTSFIANLLKGNMPKAFLDFKDKKGALFSTAILEQYLIKERNHDDVTLTKNSKDGFGNIRKLTSFSSGQQKQLLLQHLKTKTLDFLIVDKPYDCLDVASQQMLTKELTKIAQNTSIVQVFKVREEVLPFIQQYYVLKDDQVEFLGNPKAYDAFFKPSSTRPIFTTHFPKPTNSIVTENPLVKFTNVNIFYEQTRQIVNNIHWEINKGEFWHLKGPNGAGKTSLLTMITGDNPKAFGQDIVLFGRKKGTGETVWDLKKMIGYFSPNLTQFFNKLFTVEQMVLSGYYDSVGLYEKPTSQQIKHADQWLLAVGLQHQKKRYFTRLSQEMQRIVLIIRAMVKYPPLLILDEPTNELDDDANTMLTALINKIHQQTNTAIIYVSHRTLPGLNPDKVYQLTPTAQGSVGMVM